jgi:hypothetical protein
VPPVYPEIVEITPSSWSKGGSMHQKQPPAKVALSKFCPEAVPFVESPVVFVAIIRIIPKVKKVVLSIAIPSFRLSSSRGRRSWFNSKHDS